MSKLKTLSDEVSVRCREELVRLGVRGMDFVQKTGLMKSTFSAVYNGVNSAPTGFISALCTHYAADASYIITGVRSAPTSNTATANGYKSKAVAGDRSTIQETKADDKEVACLKEVLKAKDAVIAEKERLIRVLMDKMCARCDTNQENG